MTRTLAAAASIALLAGTWGLLSLLSHGEPIQAKRPFAQFPMKVGHSWKGTELRMDQEILDVLKVSDYMLRMYEPDGKGVGDNTANATPLWLYVGYYQSQRTGATYHSPKNCLPGAGWQFAETDYVTVPTPTGQLATINRVVVEKGLEKQVILYWYQDRGRIISSEYWAKVFMIWDALTKNRTDGSLVRLSIPVTTTTDEALRTGIAFLQEAWPILYDYLPSQDSAMVS